MDVQLSAQQAAMIARDVVLGVEAFVFTRVDFWVIFGNFGSFNGVTW